jgi:hypothetical protein
VFCLNVTAEIASSFHPKICPDILKECSELHNRAERPAQMKKYQQFSVPQTG